MQLELMRSLPTALICFGICLMPSLAFHPVILVPGDGGSVMWAKYDKPSVKHYWCSKKTDHYFRLWYNYKIMLPFLIECTLENLQLKYDNKTKTTSNMDGVSIKILGFGNTNSLEWLDSRIIRQSRYFANIVNSLTRHGLKRGISIRGAPYDFRKAQSELDDYYDNLKELIESTYVMNGNKTVVVVGHSLGAITSTHFFNKMDKQWKTKYIKAFVSLAGPYGGSMKTIKAILHGSRFATYGNELVFRSVERSFSSTSTLIPVQNVWNTSEVIVSTPNYNYTVLDYQKLFSDANYVNGYDMWNAFKDILLNLKAPEVETFCLHGFGLPTIEKVSYKRDFPDGKPKIEYGDGDVSVNTRSLELCKYWQDHQDEDVFYKAFPMLSHTNILRDKEILKLINYLVST